MDIDAILAEMVVRGASGLHLKVSGPPMLRINGVLAPLAGMSPLTLEDVRRAFEGITNQAQREAFSRELELDLAYQAGAVGRFRVNVSLQQGTVSLAFRAIPLMVPSLDELGLPEVCQSLAMKTRGLVLVTGPAGCGKSTTMAAMIDYLNSTQRRHIITIEDPIEYVHQDKLSLIAQRELGLDTKSFATALRHALRQDPDVIFVGEIRDLETIATAITAAETGHLVLGTMHSPSAPQAVDRIIDVFPPQQHNQIRLQLALVLEGVLWQRLLPRADGKGRVAAVGIMLGVPAVRNLIREGKTAQLFSVLMTGSEHGMRTVDQALRDLVRSGEVRLEDALWASSDPEGLTHLLGG